MAAAILQDLGIQSVFLLTNNPDKISGLESLGVQVTRRVPLVATVTEDNAAYLLTKARRMNHLLDANLFFSVESLSSNGHGHH